MKRFLSIGLVYISWALITFSSVTNAYAKDGLSFQQVYDNLDLKKNTKVHVKEYWRVVAGKEMTGSGIVYDVRGGKGKAVILVANKSRATIKGINIELVTHDNKAVWLKKGQKIRFKGILHDFKAGKLGGVIIVLREADIL